MKVDAHVHIGRIEHLEKWVLDFFKARGFSQREVGEKLSTETLLQEMNRASVDKAIVFPMGLTEEGTTRIEGINEYVAREVSRASTRLVGFFTVNPHKPIHAANEAIRAIEELNLKGLKLHPTIQEVDPSSRSLYPLYEVLTEHGLPILFHSGASVPIRSDKFSDPLNLDQVAADFPSLKIILAHAGRPNYLAIANLMRKHKNVYTDVSALKGKDGSTAFLEVTLAYIKIYADALDRVFFGSDYPIYSIHETLEALQKSRPNRFLNLFNLDISDEEMRGIMGANVQQLLQV